MARHAATKDARPHEKNGADGRDRRHRQADAVLFPSSQNSAKGSRRTVANPSNSREYWPTDASMYPFDKFESGCAAKVSTIR